MQHLWGVGLMDSAYAAYAQLCGFYGQKSLVAPLTEYEALCYEQLCRMVQASAELIRQNIEAQLPKREVVE